MLAGIVIMYFKFMKHKRRAYSLAGFHSSGIDSIHMGMRSENLNKFDPSAPRLGL